MNANCPLANSTGYIVNCCTVRSKLNKSEHVQEGPCTVRSKINQLEHIRGSWDPVQGREWSWDPVQGLSIDRYDMTENITFATRCSKIRPFTRNNVTTVNYDMVTWLVLERMTRCSTLFRWSEPHHDIWIGRQASHITRIGTLIYSCFILARSMVLSASIVILVILFISI